MNSTPPDKKPFRPRLRDMIEQLREDITIRGKYSPGEHLPSELALVKQFQLSNKTVRKGLAQLAEEGLIETIPRVGSVVKASAKTAAETLALGVMGSHDRDMKLSQLLEEFRRLNPGLRIETVQLPTFDNAETIGPYLAAGTVDALIVNDRLFWNLSESGEPFPLETVEERKETYPFLNECFLHEGELRAQPLLFSPVVLAYNKSHFEEAEIPLPDGSWTWDDAMRYAARLSTPGDRYGLCFYPLSDNRWPVFLLQSGASFDAGQGDPFRLNGTKLLENIRLAKSIIRDRTFFPDYLAESSRDFIDLFRHGKASMTVVTYMALNEFIEDPIPYDISPLPYVGEPRTLLTVIGIAVNKYSRNKAAAHGLASFLSSTWAQRLIREQTLGIPAMKQAAEDPVSPHDPLNRPSRYNLYRNIVPGYRNRWDLGLKPGSFYKLRELLKQYWSDLMDEDAFRDRLEALIDSAAKDATGAAMAVGQADGRLAHD